MNVAINIEGKRFGFLTAISLWSREKGVTVGAIKWRYKKIKAGVFPEHLLFEKGRFHWSRPFVAK